MKHRDFRHINNLLSNDPDKELVIVIADMLATYDGGCFVGYLEPYIEGAKSIIKAVRDERGTRAS